jgi:hypothetical protein
MVPADRIHVRHDEHPSSGHCVKFLAISLIALAAIGILVGIFACLVHSGVLPASAMGINSLSGIGLLNSYVLVAGSIVLFGFSSLVLTCQMKKYG